MSATGHRVEFSSFQRVVLVASLGGMEAFGTVLSGLPATFPIPVVVVQHRPRMSHAPDALAALLARKTRLPVTSVQAGQSADAPGVTVVPGATTATIDDLGRWVLTDAASVARPGDAVLTSAARLGPTVAVVLTGYLADGSHGCQAVKAAGGRVLVQEPSSARAPAMPSNAIATGCADFVLPLPRLATALVALVTAPGAADLLSVPLPPWARLSS